MNSDKPFFSCQRFHALSFSYQTCIYAISAWLFSLDTAFTVFILQTPSDIRAINSIISFGSILVQCSHDCSGFIHLPKLLFPLKVDMQGLLCIMLQKEGLNRLWSCFFHMEVCNKYIIVAWVILYWEGHSRPFYICIMFWLSLYGLLQQIP